jgi:hypothetical protein
VSFGFLCLLAVAFGVQLHDAIDASLFESGIRAVLRQHFSPVSSYYLVDIRLAREVDTTVVRAVVRGPKAPSAADVAAAQADLPPPPAGSVLKLRVRFVETVVVTPQGRPSMTTAASDDIWAQYQPSALPAIARRTLAKIRGPYT